MIDYFTAQTWADAAGVVYRFDKLSDTSANLVRVSDGASLGASLTTPTTDRVKAFVSVTFTAGWSLSGVMTGKIFHVSTSTIDWVDSSGAKVAFWSQRR